MVYRDLTVAMRKRYVDFVENSDFHKIKEDLWKEKKYCITRRLNPNNRRSLEQRFYNPNIFREFDKYYKRKKRS